MVGISAALAGLFFIIASAAFWYMGRAAKHPEGFGQIRLPADEAQRLMTDHVPARLHFSNISYTLPSNPNNPILEGITGSVKNGQVLAIMGASGAGKSTFLDILARKHKRGIVSGEVLVNGRAIPDSEFKKVMGFVDQEDTLMSTLTVYETVLYSALLRLPREMSFEAKKFRTLETMHELGILGIKDSYIGESGLDAYNAYNVVESLVSLARDYNRTVVFTIHQPRSNIVALFDQLIVLAQGKTVYAGEFAKCQDYFESIGHPCPPGFNIADYLIDLTMTEEVGPRSHVPTPPEIVLSDDGTNLGDEERGLGRPSSSRAGNTGLPTIPSAGAEEETELQTRPNTSSDTAA
ncbi:hypothetical protein FRC00_009527, partial [Tulasnella sp. 408]